MYFRGSRSFPLRSILLLTSALASFPATLLTGCAGGSVNAPASAPTSSPPTSATPGTPSAPSAPSAPGTPAAPAAAPAITSVLPATISTGSAAFSLQVNGSGFVTSSVVSWSKNPLTTTFVSSEQLQAAVPAALAANGGNNAITVANPDGQATSSSGATVAVNNPVPMITSLSPSSAVAGTIPGTVVVTGTGFVPGSIASFAGASRATVVVSSTQLAVALLAVDLGSPANAAVTVANPAPGGGVSQPASFSVTSTAPVITAITPDSIVVPAQATQITITGSGFDPESIVNVSGAILAPDTVTPTKILVTVPIYYLFAPQPLSLYVIDQRQGSHSNIVTLSLLYPAPVIQSISNQTVVAGSPAFTVTVQASGWVPETQINVNGAPLADPFFGSSNQIRVPASAVAQTGSFTISLTNPGPGGGTSNTVTVHVIAGNNYLRSAPVPANVLVWNPKQQVIYAAVPASAASNASSIVAIDPASGQVVGSQAMAAEPTALAISDDQQYLYVGMTATATIARLKLPALATDIQWTVGPAPASNYPYSIFNMQVAPGLAHTLAVTQAMPANSQGIELAVYDDGSMRPNVGTNTLQPLGYTNVFTWGADDSTIYATESADSGGPEFLYSVNAAGVTMAGTHLGALGDFNNQLLFDKSEARLFDSAGNIVDPTSGRLIGTFPFGSNSMTIDSAQHRVYVLGGTPYPDGVNLSQENPVAQLSVFDQDRFTQLDSIVISEVDSTAGPEYAGPSLIRWGTSGLAFNAGGSIYFLDGPFVTPGAPPTSSTGTYIDAPPRLAGLSPESVVAGSSDVTVTLSGQNFTPATSASWFNNNLSTTFIDNTRVQVVIPASLIAKPVTAPLYVSNSPGEGIANILAFSVLPNLGAGMQFTALNLSGSDLVWNAASQMIYVAVPDADSLRPQTLAVVDPVAGVVKSTIALAANPYTLSISQDDTYLYAGFTNSANIQRFALPALTTDLSIPLGVGEIPEEGGVSRVRGGVQSCDFAVSMGIAPGTNNKLAVTQGNPGIEILGCGPTAVFDGVTPTATTPESYLTTDYDFSHLTWGADDTALYAQGDDCCSSQPISSLTVTNTGIAFDLTNSNDIYLGWRLHFDPRTNLIYSDGGAITQPSTLAQVGNLNASGLVVPDATLGLIYVLGQPLSQMGNGGYVQGSENFTLQVFDIKTYQMVQSVLIPNVVGVPFQMIRWGASGIAFTTQDGDYEGNNAPGLTYVLSGPAIANASAERSPATEEHVQFTWHARMRNRVRLSPGSNP